MSIPLAYAREQSSGSFWLPIQGRRRAGQRRAALALWPPRAPRTGCLNRVQPSTCRIVQRCAGSRLQAHARTWHQRPATGVKILDSLSSEAGRGEPDGNWLPRQVPHRCQNGMWCTESRHTCARFVLMGLPSSPPQWLIKEQRQTEADAGYELDAMCGEAVRDSPAAAPRSNISAPQRHRRGTEPLREESVILHREGSGIGT